MFAVTMRHYGLFALIAFATFGSSAKLGAQPGDLIHRKESVYNNIFVFQRGKIRFLTFRHKAREYLESAYNTSDELDLPVHYTRYMTLGVIYPPSLQSVLMIGLGGGRTSWYLHKHLPLARFDVVELDPEIVSIAKKYFGISENGRFRLTTEDGRIYLKKTRNTYDVILLDAYRGPFVPFHLVTQEFYRLAKTRLNRGGVVVQNIEQSTVFFESAIATMRSVFRRVDVFNADGNAVAIAHDQETLSEAELKVRAQTAQSLLNTRFDLRTLVAGKEEPIMSGKAKILTDDFAPVDDLLHIDRYNRKWSE